MSQTRFKGSKAPPKRQHKDDFTYDPRQISIVERVNNRIYFYAEIENESILKLNNSKYRATCKGDLFL